MANAIRIKGEIWGRDETSMSNLKSQRRSVNRVTDVFSLGMCVNLVRTSRTVTTVYTVQRVY